MLNYVANRWRSDEESLINIKDIVPAMGQVAYEVVRTYNRLPFALKKHYTRLEKTLAFFSMEPSMNFEELVHIINEGIEKNSEKNADEFRIRIVQFPSKSICLLFEKLVTSVLKDIYELGVRVSISPYLKPSGDIMPPSIKVYGSPWITLTKKLMADNYDLVLLNEKGNVTEGSYTNIFLVKNEKLITPDIRSGVLPGVTRENILSLARAMDITIKERNVKSWELFTADELFLSHTSMGLVPVRKIEDKVLIEDFTDGLTRILLDNFEGFVMTRDDNWEGIQ
ncbi:MAG: aminotransferase class IV [Thermotogota bacterium]|nr:aminotransferase class IV [Thermotogota bacterium]